MEISLSFLNYYYTIIIDDPDKIEETIHEYIEKELKLDGYELSLSSEKLNSLIMGDIVTIKLNSRNEIDCVEKNIEEIIKKGHLICLKKCQLDINKTKICACAALNGHLEMLKWLRDPSTGGGCCDWNYNACAYAAGNNHL